MDTSAIIAICSFLTLLIGLIGYLNHNLKDALRSEMNQIKKDVGSLKKDVEIIKEAVLKG